MIDIDPDAATLLVNYAVGCAEGLVKDRRMSPKSAEEIIRKVFEGLPITAGDAQKFSVAYLKCSSLARRLGKKSIDAETVRTYFFKPSEHDRFVDDSFKADSAMNIKWDFEPSECKVQEGSVVKAEKGLALVKAVIEGKETIRECRNPIRDLKAGAYVVFHRGYIAEQLNVELRAFVENMRNSDAKNVELLKGVFKCKKDEPKVRVRS